MDTQFTVVLISVACCADVTDKVQQDAVACTYSKDIVDRSCRAHPIRFVLCICTYVSGLVHLSYKDMLRRLISVV